MPSEHAPSPAGARHFASRRVRTDLAQHLVIVGIAIAALALLAWLSRVRYLGYDDAWALQWASQATDGSLPSYDAAYAPTPHPLVNVVSAMAVGTGLPAESILLLATLAAFWTAVLLAGATGWRLYGPVAGAVTALLLATRPSLVRETQYGSTDLWFLALVSAAALLCTAGRTRPLAVLSVLALAGLVRPEAWALSAAYVIWQWRSPQTPRAGCIVLAVAPPALWMLSDFVVTGNLLHSLHGTASLAAQLDRPRTATTAVVSLPRYLHALTGGVPTVLGLAGALLAVTFFYERSLFLIGSAAIGLAMFVVLGLLDLPLLTRYLVIPAAALTLLAGVSVGGWFRIPPSDRVRRPWSLAAGGAVIVLAVSLAADLSSIDQSTNELRARRAAQADLSAIINGDRARRALEGAQLIVLPDYRAIPLVARALAIAPARFRVGPAGTPPDGTVVLSYTSLASQRAFAPSGFPAADPVGVGTAPPRTIAENRSWRVAIVR